MKKINWLDHLVNLVVVITGISIAFAMNNWKDSKSKNSLKDTYIEAMSDELTADINDLDSLLKNDSIRYKALIRLFFIDSIDLPTDSVNWAISQLASYDSFDAHNITFESLKSSGKFDVINDVKIRLSIMEYYHNSYKGITIIEDYTRNSFDNNIIPFIMEELGVRFNADLEKLKKPKFNNMVGLHLSFISQKIDAYKQGKEKALVVKKELNQLYQ